MQPGSSVDDADTGHARQVKAFGDHLCADNNVGLSTFNLTEQRLWPSGTSDGVLIPTHDPRTRKQSPCLRFDALCTGAEIVEWARAVRAATAPRLAIVTPMAKQPLAV